MVARIAPSPITTPVAIGDAHSHAVESSILLQGQRYPQAPQHDAPQFESAASAAPPPPSPPSPPGEAFAAAVIAGQLSPRPITSQELARRLGSAWQPPASPLRLMDKSA